VSKRLALPPSTDSSGFTLIEIMIAIVIMSVLSILTAQAVQSAIQQKTKFQGDIERDAAIRDAMRVMERDVNMAFHHRDFTTEMLNQIQTDASKATPTATPPSAGVAPAPTAAPATAPTPAGTPRKPPPEYTAFIGKEQSLDFTSLSHVRTTRDSAESDQAEIGYSLKTCKSQLAASKAGSTSQCIWRRVSPILDEDVTKDGTETVLLENVQEFKMRFLGPGHEDWLDHWDTTQGEASMKDTFPYAVEIYVKAFNKNDPKDKPVAMTMVVPLRFPNNAPAQDPNASPSPGANGAVAPAAAPSFNNTAPPPDLGH
jgi:prepilin-type N-terminal cleavage/methylation domain-containing protein